MVRLFLLIAALVAAPLAAIAKPIEVKVVVLTMFEVGQPTGDVAGEFQLWAERYPFRTEMTVPGSRSPCASPTTGWC